MAVLQTTKESDLNIFYIYSYVMTHINYFEPYTSKSAHHEDQLTRAFMVVLRYVPSALLIFYDCVVNDITKKAIEKNKTIEIPSISEIDLSNLNFEIQTQNIIEEFKTNKLISVLITDKTFDMQKSVSKSERTARYDGVIYFSSDVAIIIENKPSHHNVWEEQLSPSVKSVPEEIEIVPIPAIIEWKTIIKNLSSLMKNNLVGRTEREVIDDFLNFVDKGFPLLNPYDNFTDCKDNIELLNRRVKNVLKTSVANNEDSVDYHQGWGCYYLKTPLSEIWMIGFPIVKKENNDWELTIVMCFGDTLRQSKELYKNKLEFDKISSLIEKGWKYSSNFHISFMQKGLVWLDTPEKSQEKYIQFWMNNISDIKQYSKAELNSLLDYLSKNQIIKISDENKIEIQKNITDTKRKNFYISPGFELRFSFTSNKVKDLETQNKLVDEIKNKIKEGISILGKKINFIK